jgi:hypothetical protein
MTRLQKVTLGLLIGYVVWELVVRVWMSQLPPSDPVIRADLIFIYPILLIFIFLSLRQYLRGRKTLQ